MNTITEENHHIPPPVEYDEANENARVFISYRREDRPGFARAIEGQLAQELGKKNVFIDVDDIVPGTDYQDHIHMSIYSCDVLVVIIGENWNSSTSDGVHRLDNPKDWVRQEIATALNRNIKIIPVLLNGVDMPDESELPEELERLARYEAIEITNSQFKLQSKQLINTIRDALKRSYLNIIKLWVMRNRVLALSTMIFILAFTFLYHKKIYHLTIEHSADTLSSIGLSEENYISDLFEGLGVRNLTISLYKEALEHIQDDTHKAKVMAKLAQEFDLHIMDFQIYVTEYFQQAREILDKKIDRSSGRPDLYLARAELLEKLGFLLISRGSDSNKDVEVLFTAAIDDYRRSYSNIDKADDQSRANYAELNYQLAMIMRKQQHYNKAKAYFTESLRMCETLEPSRLSLEVAQAFVSMLEINLKNPSSTIKTVSSS